LNRQRHFINVNLLNHTSLASKHGWQPMVARGAKVHVMIEEPNVDSFGRERSPFVATVSRLATDLASVLAFWNRRIR